MSAGSRSLELSSASATLQLLGHLMLVAKDVAARENLDKGFRLGEFCVSIVYLMSSEDSLTDPVG